MSVVWEEPPGVSHGSRARSERQLVWDELIEACQANPGRWAKHPRTFAVNARASFVSALSHRGLNPVEWEYTNRLTDGDPKKRTLYVRYVGGES